MRSVHIRLAVSPPSSPPMPSQTTPSMPEDVEKNPQKNALISFVGKGRELLVDTGRMEFDPSKGDMLILCSDGLYKALSDSEILATALSGTGDKTRLPELLLNTALANKRIRHDNITVMVII